MKNNNIENFFKKSKKVIEIENNTKVLNDFDIEKLVQKINLDTNARIEDIKNYYTNWININGEWYYFKPFNEILYIINELICEVIAEYFNIDSIHNELAILKKDNIKYYGLLSKSICNKNYVYMTSEGLELKYFDNISFLNYFESFIYTDNYEELIKEIKRFIIFELYCNQQDRHIDNLLFKIKFDKNRFKSINLAPLYDYELSFYSKKLYEYRNAFLKLNIKQKNNIRIIQNDEYYQMLIKKLLDANMEYFLEEVIRKYDIKISNNYKNIFINQDKKLKKLTLENGLLY